MGRAKLEKIVALDAAEGRLAALKSIDTKLDLGDGRDVKSFGDAIVAARTAVSDYNTMLSAVDEKYNAAQKAIKAATALSTRMLSGVGSKWGNDSDQYEKAGGTRASERKKPVRKPKTTFPGS